MKITIKAILVCAFVSVLSGCGSSSEERQAKTELAETQNELTAIRAELLATQKDRKEDAQKSASEIELLHKQLLDAKNDLLNAQTKLLASQEDVKRATPPPSCEVVGDVFIVTRGGVNFKLGLVSVQVFEKTDIENYVAKKKEEQVKLLAEFELNLKSAQNDLDQSIIAKNNADDANTVAAHSGSKQTEEAAYAVFSAAWDLKRQKEEKLASIKAEGRALLTGSFFFSQLPRPELVVKSNADGQFRFTKKRDMQVVIAASAGRAIGDNTEQYFWLIPVTNTEGNSTEITLSNDNLTSVQNGGSLVYTSD
ncbi:MAG TPA: hypothetical protein VIK62_01120 [Verrucomicrobiae bacterium]